MARYNVNQHNMTPYDVVWYDMMWYDAAGQDVHHRDYVWLSTVSWRDDGHFGLREQSQTHQEQSSW